MWCLETIIALNEKAAELAAAGRPITEAYAAVGISMPRSSAVAADVRQKNNKPESQPPVKAVA